MRIISNGNGVRTSENVAKKASIVLRDGSYSEVAKSTAASALVNRKETTK